MLILECETAGAGLADLRRRTNWQAWDGSQRQERDFNWRLRGHRHQVARMPGPDRSRRLRRAAAPVGRARERAAARESPVRAAHDLSRLFLRWFLTITGLPPEQHAVCVSGFR